VALQVKPEQAYAYAELLEVLSFMDQSYIKKIPKKLMAIFQANALVEYEKHINQNQPLEEQGLSEKTTALIAMLTVQYWCETKEQKQELLNLFKENEKKYQKELRQKYNPDNIFCKEDKLMQNLDNELDKIDEIERISQEENEKSKQIAKQIQERKERELAAIQNKKHAMLMDYSKLPWYKKAFTKIKNFVFEFIQNFKNAA